MLETIIISSLKILLELVKCFLESQQSALGSVQSPDERESHPLCPLTLQRCHFLFPFRDDGRKNLPPQISLWAGWTDVPFSVHFADFKMNRIHLWNFRGIKKRQRRPFKAFPCGKLLVFLPLASANFKALLYLCFFRLPNSLAESQIVFKQGEKNTRVFSCNVQTPSLLSYIFVLWGMPEVDNFNWYISEECIILGDDLFQKHFNNKQRYLHLIKTVHSFGKGIRDKNDFCISPIMLGRGGWFLSYIYFK